MSSFVLAQNDLLRIHRVHLKSSFFKIQTIKERPTLLSSSGTRAVNSYLLTVLQLNSVLRLDIFGNQPTSVTQNYDRVCQKTYTIVTRSHAFSRALRQLP